MEEISAQGVNLEGREFGHGDTGVPSPVYKKGVFHATGHFDTILQAKFRSAFVVITFECHDNANRTRSDLLLLSVIGKGFGVDCKVVLVATAGSSTGVAGDIKDVEYQLTADDVHLNATLKAKVARIGSTGAGNYTVSGSLTAP